MSFIATLLASITWPVVAALFAGGVPFFAFLHGILKKPSENWKGPISGLQKQVAVLENELKALKDKIQDVDDDLKKVDERLSKRADDQESKMDRFIEMITNFFINKN